MLLNVIEKGPRVTVETSAQSNVQSPNVLIVRQSTAQAPIL
jgi:hypothetical protein